MELSTNFLHRRKKYGSAKRIEVKEDPKVELLRQRRKTAHDKAAMWSKLNQERQEDKPPRYTFGLDFTLYNDANDTKLPEKLRNFKKSETTRNKNN